MSNIDEKGQKRKNTTDQYISLFCHLGSTKHTEEQADM